MTIRANFKAHASARMNILSEDQCYELVMAATEAMWRTGTDFHDKESLEILKKAGCWVEGKRVRIPAHITERCLRTCQKHVVLCNSRTGARELFIEGNNAYFGSGPCTPFTRNPFTNERHRATRQSVGWATKVLDALPNIDYAMSLGIVQDVPLLVSDRHEFEQQILHTDKPIITVCNDKWGQEDVIKMAEIIAGGEEELRKNPFICLYAEPISPGVHCKEAAQKLVMGAKKALPTIYTPCIMAGGTAPATMAGVMVQGLCESLSGMVLSQCTREGAPFIMGGVYTVLDMGTTIFSYGAPELHLLLAGLADVAHYLNIPMFGTAGCTDSCIIDEQAGIEAALSIAMTNMSGANLNHDTGYSEYGTTSNLDLVVIADEVLGMARRLTAGIRVDQETLALEVIEKVGPGGSFADEDHTAEHAEENYMPRLVNRAARSIWESAGGKPLTQVANEKVRDIINYHEPIPLPKDMAAKIRDIVENAVGHMPGEDD
ncbi:trimethylamine methyltransferase family protein [Sporomusa sphaeroides DSM 2875]|uniref:trimethylamine methyltransferase family protein n=1 Tax=Sporomusa sphaeroides TaxID=47679 RepID=UPI002030AA3A|nr:trimethylamine methyltransferase family protein [Sporomusa sphaeroides]MCM0758151.1 trimethylamine methyltransferase family protein [Sporomusa sphaeroides DSM 2875]